MRKNEVTVNIVPSMCSTCDSILFSALREAHVSTLHREAEPPPLSSVSRYNQLRHRISEHRGHRAKWLDFTVNIKLHLKLGRD